MSALVNRAVRDPQSEHVNFFFATLNESSVVMKKCASQTSIDTHPEPVAEASEQRVEIIATFYTVDMEMKTAVFADSAKANASLLGIEDRLIVLVEVL